MKKAAFLFAVYRIVGGVKVQDEFLGSMGKGSDEPLNQPPVNDPGGLTIRTVLPVGVSRSCLAVARSKATPEALSLAPGDPITVS